MEQLIDINAVHYYDIEVASDVEVNPDDEKSIAENNEFHRQTLVDCTSWASPCQSLGCMDDYNTEKSRLWLNKRIKMTDIDYCKDKFDFHVIAHLDHGVRKNTFLTIRECKKCHCLQFYGSGSSVSLLMSILDTDMINRGVLNAGIDLSTGEGEMAGSLGDNIVLTDLEGTPLPGKIEISDIADQKEN